MFVFFTINEHYTTMIPEHFQWLSWAWCVENRLGSLWLLNDYFSSFMSVSFTFYLFLCNFSIIMNRLQVYMLCKPKPT